MHAGARSACVPCSRRRLLSVRARAHVPCRARLPASGFSDAGLRTVSSTDRMRHAACAHGSDGALERAETSDDRASRPAAYAGIALHARAGGKSKREF
eukprot:6203678-Pleurochrysis_carterae.AAC.1